VKDVGKSLSGFYTARLASFLYAGIIKDASTYVLRSNMYAAVGKRDQVSLVWAMMHERGVLKEPGRSWIEVYKRIHDFVEGDTSHPEAKKTYAELNKLTEKYEKLKVTFLILGLYRAVSMRRTKNLLAICSDSEKAAFAYGLIRTPPGGTIRTFKNLRVCSGCHAATKFISKVTRRERDCG